MFSLGIKTVDLTSFISDNDSNITNNNCSYYGRLNTTGFGIIRAYEGIPENILVNLIAATVLLFIFVYLRRRFSDGKNTTDATQISNVLYGSNNVAQRIQNKTYWRWVRDLFNITDWDICQSCSIDAYYYLLYHTYLIFYLLFVTILSVAVVLPMNFQGKQEDSEQTFAHTTIANLSPNSPFLWAHICTSILFVVVSIAVVYWYKRATGYYAMEDMATRTLMIHGIPQSARDEDKLSAYFREAYATLQLTHITLVYNVVQLQKLVKHRTFYQRLLEESQTILERTGKRPVAYLGKCGQLCSCCTSKIDAIEHYEKLYGLYRQRLEDEFTSVKEKKCGIAFVTFSTFEEAYQVYSDFRTVCFVPCRRPTTSTSKTLEVHRWSVSFAPNPKNIIWKNIPTSVTTHWCRIIFVNMILLIFMVFLTTPSVVISTIDKIINKYRSIDAIKTVTEQIHLPVLLTSVVPVLLLRIFAAVMPSLVSVTSLLEKNWKKSRLETSMMIKLFSFLLMMILILPSLGLTSVEGFLRWVFQNDGTETNKGEIRWMCVFLPDNGAFFVNYVVTSAFIGAAIELLRLADLVSYIYAIATAKSTAERQVIRHNLQFPFRFGVQYAWTAAVFCVILAYSIICPLITPIGLVYMFIKRAVDKYNLVFVYDTEIADRSVHRLAGNFILVASVLQQLILLFFIIVRSESLAALSIVMLGSFVLTGGVCIYFSSADCCTRQTSGTNSLSRTILPQRVNVRETLDDFDESEEIENDDTVQTVASSYLPGVFNLCRQEFETQSNPVEVRRSSTRESMARSNYGTVAQMNDNTTDRNPVTA